MIEILFNLGIREEDLKFMIEQVPGILDMSDKEINDKIDMLRYVGCVDRHIKNIIISNPYYLDRLDDDILKLIGYLKQVGFSNINLLFDSNPFFLDKDVFEIKEYIDNKINDGYDISDIVDLISSNPYIIDEE